MNLFGNNSIKIMHLSFWFSKKHIQMKNRFKQNGYNFIKDMQILVYAFIFSAYFTYLNVKKLSMILTSFHKSSQRIT